VAESGVTRAGNVREAVIPNLFRDLKAENSEGGLRAQQQRAQPPALFSTLRFRLPPE
jgi:hypothetical protein